ncbi:MAG: hypothetical protein V1494_06020 [Candidatus Diapherotrites archaeon]
MTDLFLPNLNSRSKSSKELIIEVLASQWPLSVKEIHSALKKNYSLDVSYQAVHKTAKELLDAGILEEINSQLKISKEWINKMQDYSEKLQNSYSGSGFGQKIDLTTTQVEFSTLWAMYEFVIDGLDNDFFDSNKTRIGSSFLNHYWNWFPMILGKKYLEKLLRMGEKYDHHMICSSTEKADQWIAGYYQKIGWKPKLGIPVQKHCDIIVPGDSIVTAYFGDNLKEALHGSLHGIEKIEEMDIIELYKSVCALKTKVILTINRNPIAAEQIHAQARKYFEGVGK